MSDIEELSSRITSALDRVAGGLDAVVQVDNGEADALRAALAEEKQTTDQLNERVRALGERHEQAVSAMDARTAEMAGRMDALDTEVQQLRQANVMLADACDALREANAAGVGDPDLINKAIEAELGALRAARNAERAEADEILAGLLPLLNASASVDVTGEA